MSPKIEIFMCLVSLLSAVTIYAMAVPVYTEKEFIEDTSAEREDLPDSPPPQC